MRPGSSTLRSPRIRVAMMCGGLVATAVTLWASPPDSHMGQKIADHVTLKLTDGICFNTFDRVLPNGQTVPFEIPGNRLLVVTDVEWLVLPTEPFEDFGGQQLRLRIELADGATVFLSRPITITPENRFGPVGSSEQLTTGFVVGTLSQFCAQVRPNAEGFDENLWQLILRGYLINISREFPY